ncbi:MAG: gamma-glutamylcyclotransferase [Acidimicrobiia bacterium]|nr:gamma-glutamylcyclotransferase [Acidimicrobiia bacterium]
MTGESDAGPAYSRVEPIRYFAYGSNMNTRQMAQRCPTARVVQLAILERYAPLVNVRGVLTLRSSVPGRTHGVLWHLEAADLVILDRLEGVDEGRYDRVERPVLLESGVTTAFVYIDPRMEVGRVRPGYLERVLHGAREHGLPQNYVDHLQEMQDIARDE